MQKTIDKQITFEGIGLHSGVTVTVCLKPAEANTRIVFERVDDVNGVIKALYSNVVETRLGTTIANNEKIIVSTIEHLMAALWACDIDNVIIEINNQEVPILDGSAINFVEQIEKVGVKELEEKRKILKVLKPVVYEYKDTKIVLKPYDGFKINMEVEFPYGNISFQKDSFELGKDSFKDALGFARTFCNVQEIEMMRQMNLAKGGSLDNAAVYDQNGIVNESGVRCENEVVKHKILDCIGDLFTSGYFMNCEVEAFKTGHTQNNEVLKNLFADEKNYVIE